MRTPILVALTSVAVGCASAGPPASLEVGRTVRFIAPSVADTMVTASVTALAADTVTLRTESTGEHRLSVQDLTSLQVLNGRRGHAGTGAVFGFLTGAAFALGAGSALDYKEGTGATGYLYFGALFGGPGALLGGAIGSQIHTDRWDRLIPAPRVRVARGISRGTLELHWKVPAPGGH